MYVRAKIRCGSLQLLLFFRIPIWYLSKHKVVTLIRIYKSNFIFYNLFRVSQQQCGFNYKIPLFKMIRICQYYSIVSFKDMVGLNATSIKSNSFTESSQRFTHLQVRFVINNFSDVDSNGVKIGEF